MRPIGPAARKAGPRRKCRAGQEVVIGGWKTTQRQVPLADGRRQSRRSSGLCRHGRHRFRRRTRSGASCRHLKAGAPDKRPFGGKNAPKKTARRALAEARTRRRDRVCRLDRRWQCRGRRRSRACGRTSRQRRWRRRARPTASRRRRCATKTAVRRRRVAPAKQSRRRGDGRCRFPSRTRRCGPMAATASR